MRFTSSWLRNWKHAAPAARRSKPTSRRRRAGYSPLEALEDRRLLSTLTVTSAGDSGAGSLRAVIAAAQSGDTIVFSPTLFSSPKTILLTSGQLSLTKSLTIQGLGADLLTISGNDNSRVFEVAQSVTVTLSGITIDKGYPGITGGPGGGILNHGTLTVSNSNLFGNLTGIYNAGGTLTIGDNSTLAGNYAGGGIYNDGGTVAVSNSTIYNNTSQYGGGIYNSSGTLTITNSTLSGNTARTNYNGVGGHGGGIYNLAGMVTISNSTLSGNYAMYFSEPLNYGGGIYNAAGGTVTVKNSSSITGNVGLEDARNLGVLFLDSTSTSGVVWGNPAISMPEVMGSEFHFATGPQALRFAFDRDVGASLGTDDLILQNLTTGHTIPASDLILSYDENTSTATFTYTGSGGGFGGVLPDGNYRALLLAAGIATPAGAPLAEDLLFDFFFLNGDANHDGTVNLADFNILAANFGQSNRTLSDADFNYDGMVNLADFNILASRFGNVLPEPAGRGLFTAGGAEENLRSLRQSIVTGKTTLSAKFSARIIEELHAMFAGSDTTASIR